MIRKQLSRLLYAAMLSAVGLAGLGCARPAYEMAKPESRMVVRVGRTAVERQKLIKPGQFGENGAANARRVFFDFFNEQIIREDREVGTVFMGDSITELWDLHVYFSSVRNELIENRGIGGDLARIMAKRFEADVIQLRPRNVVILAGTNDVNYLPSKGMSDDGIFADVVASMESMMDAAQKAGVNVFICSILPTNDDFGMHNQHVGLRVRINERLKAICEAKKCVYVDYATPLQDAGGSLRKDLSTDGLHPHWAGYKIMADALKTAAKRSGLHL